MTEDVARLELDGGLRVVTERMPAIRSVTLGVYAAVGSRDEPAELAGTSHFLEHLLFKGTAQRTARQLAVAVDGVGGEMNAYTGRETTAYVLRLPAADLAFGLDLLADVITAPAFRPDEVEAEREVILDELLMADDDPDDVAHTQLLEMLFPGHALGRETLGSRDTVRALSRDTIAAFHAERYVPGALVLAAAGAIDSDEVVGRVATSFGSSRPVPPGIRARPDDDVEALRVVRRPTEQVHLSLGWRGVDLYDDDRHALVVANHILGGGTASRLFQEVREERGLTYGIYSSTGLLSDAGTLVVTAGTAPTRLGELITVVDEVIEALLAEGVTAEEHAVALGYLEGSTLLGLEDSGTRMGRLAMNELIRGRVVPVDEYLARLHAVTVEDVDRVLRRVLDAPRAVAAVGPLDDADPVLAQAAAWRRQG